MDGLIFTRGSWRTCLLLPSHGSLVEIYDFIIDLRKLVELGTNGPNRRIAPNWPVCTMVEAFGAIPGCPGDVRVAARLFFSGIGEFDT